MLQHCHPVLHNVSCQRPPAHVKQCPNWVRRGADHVGKSQVAWLHPPDYIIHSWSLWLYLGGSDSHTAALACTRGIVVHGWSFIFLHACGQEGSHHLVFVFSVYPQFIKIEACLEVSKDALNNVESFETLSRRLQIICPFSTLPQLRRREDRFFFLDQ